MGLVADTWLCAPASGILHFRHDRYGGFTTLAFSLRPRSCSSATRSWARSAILGSVVLSVAGVFAGLALMRT
jgi:hypothetical protein